MWKAAIIGVVVLVTGGGTPRGQESTTQPTSRQAPSNLERLNALIAVIEGNNPPDVRRTIAREALLQQWPETPPRLISILSGSNGPAKVAVGGALAELPQYLETGYSEPLLGMLGDNEAEVRDAAAGALAAYRDGGVIPRLRKRVLEVEQPTRTRLAAIATLGLMTQREAIEVLVEALKDPDTSMVSAALGALSQATAIDFDDDDVAARKWWEDSRSLPLEAWQQRQIERLVRKDRETRARLDVVETRLAKFLEANFQRGPDAERIALLTAYLSENAASMRLLGLKLARLHLNEGRSLPSDLSARIRDLMASKEPAEQAAAVRTVASFRESQDAEQFRSMLATAQNREVRLALLYGLGYVGNAAAVSTLLELLGGSDEESTTEAVAALGRLAERGAIPEQTRAAVADALLQVFAKTKPTQVALRERTLWAMGNIADPSFGPALAAALDRAEAVAVRQAAVRGIAAAKDPKLADALVPVTNDVDPGVRRSAVETLAVLGSSDNDKHLQALWGRLTSPPETDEAIRQAAWRGLLGLLPKRRAEDFEEWFARLPGTGKALAQRAVELLARRVKVVEDTSPQDHAQLGGLRARIAAQQVQLEQASEAIGQYLKALDDLRAAKSPTVQRVAIELLRCALASGKYDQAVATAIGGANAGVEPAAIWQTIRTEVEARLTPENVDQALAILNAVEGHPPGTLPPEATEGLKELHKRAGQLKQAAGGESQPNSAPTSRPRGT